MTRLADWERRLADYLASKADVLFTFGATDCALFCADAVEAITGVDPVPEFRGRYTTASGAMRALKRYGAGTLAATIGGKFPAIPIGFAGRGDLVMVDGMVGVCIGSEALFVGEERTDGVDVPGLVRFPRDAWSHAWRVG